MAETLADFPTLNTDRLRLAPLRVEDAPALVGVSDNPEILSTIAFLPKSFGVPEAEALIRAKEDGQDRFLGIWLKNSGALAGVFGVHLQERGRLEIGYWLSPALHGRGYATEAGRAVLAEVRRRFPQRKMIAHVLPTNDRSLNVLRKLGFRPSQGEPTRPERNLFELPA